MADCAGVCAESLLAGCDECGGWHLLLECEDTLLLCEGIGGWMEVRAF